MNCRVPPTGGLPDASRGRPAACLADSGRLVVAGAPFDEELDCAAKVENSRLTRGLPQLLQVVESSPRPKTSSSNFESHSAQRYSKIGIRFVPEGLFFILAGPFRIYRGPGRTAADFGGCLEASGLVGHG